MKRNLIEKVIKINALKINITSNELKTLNKIESNRKIYKILHKEMKDNIHSLQILIS